MKKLLFVLMAASFVSCGGTATVDKVDEKGYNPAPEQVIDSDCIPAMLIDSTIVIVNENL